MPKEERIGFVAVAVAAYGAVVIAGVVYDACHQLFNVLWAASAPHLVVSIGVFFIINARAGEVGRMRSWMAVRCLVGVLSIVAAAEVMGVVAVVEAVEVVVVGDTGRATCYGFFAFNYGYRVPHCGR